MPTVTWEDVLTNQDLSRFTAEQLTALDPQAMYQGEPVLQAVLKQPDLMQALVVIPKFVAPLAEVMAATSSVRAAAKPIKSSIKAFLVSDDPARYPLTLIDKKKFDPKSGSRHLLKLVLEEAVKSKRYLPDHYAAVIEVGVNPYKPGLLADSADMVSYALPYFTGGKTEPTKEQRPDAYKLLVYVVVTQELATPDRSLLDELKKMIRQVPAAAKQGIIDAVKVAINEMGRGLIFSNFLKREDVKAKFEAFRQRNVIAELQAVIQAEYSETSKTLGQIAHQGNLIASPERAERPKGGDSASESESSAAVVVGALGGPRAPVAPGVPPAPVAARVKFDPKELDKITLEFHKPGERVEEDSAPSGVMFHDPEGILSTKL